MQEQGATLAMDCDILLVKWPTSYNSEILLKGSTRIGRSSPLYNVEIIKD